MKKVGFFLDRTTYFRFFIAFNLLYCTFFKFLMVTEEWNPVVRAGSSSCHKKTTKKLTNIKLLSLTYYNYNILRVAFTLKLYIGVDFINNRSFSVYLLFCTRIT